MNHMKKWNDDAFKGIAWEDRIKTDYAAQHTTLKLDLFWAGSEECRQGISKLEDSDREMKKCRWEGCVEQYMVLESNAEWMAARQLLGLQSLKDARTKPPPKVKSAKE